MEINKGLIKYLFPIIYLGYKYIFLKNGLNKLLPY